MLLNEIIFKLRAKAFNAHQINNIFWKWVMFYSTKYSIREIGTFIFLTKIIYAFLNNIWSVLVKNTLFITSKWLYIACHLKNM